MMNEVVLCTPSCQIASRSHMENPSRNKTTISVTVVICTYNRADSLGRTLVSVAACDTPPTLDWEVLIVDNNSTDGTRELVTEFCSRPPHRFRYVFERQQGLSHARNAGIREAQGEIVVFTDDDVTVEKSWLRNLVAPLADPEWAGAGGRIEPVWTSMCPDWLSPNEPYALGPLVMFDRGPTSRELREAPFGANMAFRKWVFERHGGFRADLGNRPGSEIRNDDSEFGARILAAGERLRYEPAAIVYHPVAENRLQRSYFLMWWFDKGRGDVRQYGRDVQGRYCAAGVPLYLFRNLAVWTVRWLTAISPRRRFFNKLKVWKKMGEIWESYALASQSQEVQ